MLKSISIRELFLLILIVALFLAWLKANSTRHELAQLRYETGHFRAESDNVIYVRQRDSERASQWRFRVNVPKGVNYQYVWSYDLQNEKPVFPTVNVDCLAKQLDLVVFVEHRPNETNGLTTFRCVGHGSADNAIYIDAKIAECFKGKFSSFVNYSKYPDHFAATTGYDDLDEYPLGETIQLLRFEGSHPETGKQLWIELNMVPISEADYYAQQKAMTPAPGTVKMGSTPTEKVESED